MKILFYSHTSKISGAENILLLLIERLDKQRFAPSAVCSGEGPLPECIRAIGVPCVSTVELNARFTLNPFRFVRYIKSVIQNASSLRNEITKTSPDLIHANSIRAGIVAASASFGSRVPVYWHLQDELGTHPISTAIRLYVAFSNRIRFIAASDATLKSFRGTMLRVIGKKTPAAVIHNVVDSSKFNSDPGSRMRLRKEFGVKNGKFLIGTIGQITPRKGQLELIEAFARCLNEGLNSKLLIIGSPIFNSDHQYLAKLKRAAEDLGVAHSVEFTGFRGDIPDLMSALDTVVINSKSEAFVVVGVEGLAAGVPVIATDVGGIREMLTHGENGLITSFGDQEALTTAILKVAGDRGLREKFAARGREIVNERLNADEFIRAVESFFDIGQRLESSKKTNRMRGLDRMPKIAIVHDYFIQEGGAEKVADELQRIFPEAQMFATVSNRESNGNHRRTVTSWMQRFPINVKNHRYLFLLYPFAVESLDLTAYDIIITSTSGYAKGVRKRDDAIHICYCHTPMRWVWFYNHYAERENFGSFKQGVLPFLLKGLQKWDIRASKRPDYYIANSIFVAERIKEFYGRDATVIPPPIDVDRFKTGVSNKDFFLVLSRLVPYKRLDIAVEACKRLGRKLVVIGDGSARSELERIAGPETVFLGHQPDNVVNKYARECRALIFPGEEDFGMTPLEINASGRPVIAFKSGGAKETIIEGETGMFFEEQNARSLSEAIIAFEQIEWDPETLRNHARKFDCSVFQDRILSFVGHVADAHTELVENPESFGVQPALKKGVV